jgi:DNA-binding NtrC family response regulator
MPKIDAGRDVPLDEILNSIERQEIIAALRRAQGHRAQAAQMLGITRSRLYRRMAALGVDVTSAVFQWDDADLAPTSLSTPG